MQHRSHRADDVDEVRALNRLFIDFLRTEARRGADCLGLTGAALASLRAASVDSLDAVAEFPRALFQVTLAPTRPLGVIEPRADTVALSRYVLQVTILHSAWALSRRNPWAARLFLGLEERDVRDLRALALFEIPRVSARGQLVTCAFPHCAWLWQKLLTDTRPETRRQLLLIALQPQLQAPVLPPRAAGRRVSA